MGLLVLVFFSDCGMILISRINKMNTDKRIEINNKKRLL